jgi:hypothetical protein
VRASAAGALRRRLDERRHQIALQCRTSRSTRRRRRSLNRAGKCARRCHNRWDGTHWSTLSGSLCNWAARRQMARRLDAVQFFDEQSSRWVALAPLPAPLANLAATTSRIRRFTWPGAAINPTARDDASCSPDQLLRYETDSPTCGRSSISCPILSPAPGWWPTTLALYLVGGWDGQNMRDEIWRYAPGSQAGWELVEHLAKGRAFLGAASVRGDLYIAGGYDGEREVELLERFTPATGEVQELAPMATPRGGLALVYDGVALYAIGGGWTAAGSEPGTLRPGNQCVEQLSRHRFKVNGAIWPPPRATVISTSPAAGPATISIRISNFRVPSAPCCR